MKKQNTKHVFTHECFNLSTDYKWLWRLIKQGYRIPAWIVYSDEYDFIVWDLVDVKPYPSIDGLINYTIGTRGIGYENYSKNFACFEKVCTDLSLHFIKPHKD